MDEEQIEKLKRKYLDQYKKPKQAQSIIQDMTPVKLPDNEIQLVQEQQFEFEYNNINSVNSLYNPEQQTKQYDDDYTDRVLKKQIQDQINMSNLINTQRDSYYYNSPENNQRYENQILKEENQLLRRSQEKIQEQFQQIQEDKINEKDKIIIGLQSKIQQLNQENQSQQYLNKTLKNNKLNDNQLNDFKKLINQNNVLQQELELMQARYTRDLSLKDVEIETLSNKNKRLEKDIQNSKTQNEKQEIEIEILNQKIISLDLKVLDVEKNNHKDLQHQLDNFHKENLSLRTQLNDQIELNKLNNQNDSNQIKDLNQKLDQLENDKLTLKGNQDRLQSQNDELNTLYGYQKEKDLEYDDIKSNLQNLLETISNLQIKIKTLQQDNDYLTLQNKKLKIEKDHDVYPLKRRIEELESKFKESNDQRVKLQNLLTTETQKNNNLNQLNDRLTDKQNSSEIEINRLKQSLDDQYKELFNKKTKFLQMENEKLQNQIQSLNSQLNFKTEEYRNTNQKMQELQNQINQMYNENKNLVQTLELKEKHENEQQHQIEIFEIQVPDILNENDQIRNLLSQKNLECQNLINSNKLLSRQKQDLIDSIDNLELKLNENFEKTNKLLELHNIQLVGEIDVLREHLNDRDQQIQSLKLRLQNTYSLLKNEFKELTLPQQNVSLKEKEQEIRKLNQEYLQRQREKDDIIYNLRKLLVEKDKLSKVLKNKLFELETKTQDYIYDNNKLYEKNEKRKLENLYLYEQIQKLNNGNIKNNNYLENLNVFQNRTQE